MSEDFPIVSSEEDNRLLTNTDLNKLANIPLEAEWFANIENENTRRAYRRALADFMDFVGIEQIEDESETSDSSNAPRPWWRLWK